MVKAIARYRGLMCREDGQDIIEYALLASLIMVVVVALVGDATNEVGTLWTYISSTIVDALN